MKPWAYVFITIGYPKRTLPLIRAIKGVVHANALFGTTDIIAIFFGNDIKDMDEVINRMAELKDIIGTDTKVARWLNEIGPPKTYNI